MFIRACLHESVCTNIVKFVGGGRSHRDRLDDGRPRGTASKCKGTRHDCREQAPSNGHRLPPQSHLHRFFQKEGPSNCSTAGAMCKNIVCSMRRSSRARNSIGWVRRKQRWIYSSMPSSRRRRGSPLRPGAGSSTPIFLKYAKGCKPPCRRIKLFGGRFPGRAGQGKGSQGNRSSRSPIGVK